MARIKNEVSTPTKPTYQRVSLVRVELFDSNGQTVETRSITLFGDESMNVNLNAEGVIESRRGILI